MKLKKELGLLEVFCISSGTMISSGLFILPAIGYAKVGVSIIISYTIASLLIIPTVLSKAELITAMPKTGGIFFLTDRSMGPMVGTLGGLGAWLSIAFKTAFALLGIGIILTYFNPGLSEVQIKLIAIGCCLFFTMINLTGVKLVGKVQAIIVVTLICLLVLYVILGTFSPSMDFSRYETITDNKFGSIFATAGLVFVSYAGTTKVISVAGEVKHPERSLPYGMFLSWGVVSILYLTVISITIGIVPEADLKDSLTPITLGGGVILGSFGVILMSIAAFLAFISTGNSGILASSRDPMAMGKDDLLPAIFCKVSKYGTPYFAIIFTSAVMITVMWFLDLENFVKTASTLKLMIFILANLGLIFMRESNIRHYRPRYKAPFYPWIQIIGIFGCAALIFFMGIVPLMVTGIFLLCGLGWYFIYAHGKIKREYALLHVAERVTGIKSTDNLLDEELREILIDRDDIIQDKFEDKIEDCVVLDLNHFVAPNEFAKIVAKPLSEKLKLSEKELYKRLKSREKDSNIIVRPGFAVISFHIKGRRKFEIALVRTKRGAIFSDDEPPVHAAFIIVSTPDKQNFYLHSLMWMVEVEEELDFGTAWKKAKNNHELREVFRSAFRKRHVVLEEQDLIEQSATEE